MSMCTVLITRRHSARARRDYKLISETEACVSVDIERCAAVNVGGENEARRRIKKR